MSGSPGLVCHVILQRDRGESLESWKVSDSYVILNKPCISPQIPALEILRFRSSFQSHGPVSTANVKNGGSFGSLRLCEELWPWWVLWHPWVVLKWKWISYRHVFRRGYCDSPLTWNISRGYSRSWTKQLLLMIPQHLKKKRSLPSLSTFIHSHFGIGSRPNIPPKTGTWWFTRSVRQAAMSFHFFKSAKALLCLLALCKTFDDRGIDHLSLTSETKSDVVSHKLGKNTEFHWDMRLDMSHSGLVPCWQNQDFGWIILLLEAIWASQILGEYHPWELLGEFSSGCHEGQLFVGTHLSTSLENSTPDSSLECSNKRFPVDCHHRSYHLTEECHHHTSSELITEIPTTEFHYFQTISTTNMKDANWNIKSLK